MTLRIDPEVGSVSVVLAGDFKMKILKRDFEISMGCGDGIVDHLMSLTEK